MKQNLIIGKQKLTTIKFNKYSRNYKAFYQNNNAGGGALGILTN